MNSGPIGRGFFAAACVLITAASSFSQTRGRAPDPVTESTKQSSGATTHILYTGKLLGYFRVPDRQPLNATGCPALIDGSQEARQFIDLRNRHRDAILVGTGDNFAPEFGARVFSDVRPGDSKKREAYKTGNKELWMWDATSWFPYQDLDNHRLFRAAAARGYGSVPTDNVGCFLSAAGYDAVVPGKHDFYFGPERVRQLARFMASIEKRDGYKPVQMLAANLVIKTSWAKNHKPLSDKVDPPAFIPWWPAELVVKEIQDGKPVYPWLSTLRIKIAEFDPKAVAPEPKGQNTQKRFSSLKDWIKQKLDSYGYNVEGPTKMHCDVEKEINSITSNAAPMEVASTSRVDPAFLPELTAIESAIGNLAHNKVWICPADRLDPNNVTAPGSDVCREPLQKGKVLLKDNRLEYDLDLPELADGGKDCHYSTLPGQNYGLWLAPVPAKEGAVDPKKSYCLRFSVYFPFFFYPAAVPALSDGRTSVAHYEPDPYYTGAHPFLRLLR